MVLDVSTSVTSPSPQTKRSKIFDVHVHERQDIER